MPKLKGLHRPATVDEAIALLSGDPEARPIAGGATLVAMMNARLAQPAALVSLAGIAELRGLAREADGRIRIGAFTRHRETAASELLEGTLSVVRDAARQIANATVRNMGTIGGSIAFADPALDYPPALLAAEAAVEIAGPAGRRELPAAEFFVDWYTTALEPGEIVVAVRLPAPRPGRGVYRKLARVAGDYAIASVALSADDDGRARVAVGACGPVPLRSSEADALVSAAIAGADAAEARDRLGRAGELLRSLADPVDDVRGSAEYRRLVIPRLLAQAAARVRPTLQEAA